MKKDPDDFNTALRVLARSIYREEAAPRDINILRRNARADEAGLPIEELCCRILHRALCSHGSAAGPLKPPDSPSGSAR